MDKIIVGDSVFVKNFLLLTDKQLKYLNSRNTFEVYDVMIKNDVQYIDVGYKIPFKLDRFEKINIKYEHKVLFLQFNLKIDMHGMTDNFSFFKGCEYMSNLFPLVINEKLPNTKVDFLSYKDIFIFKDNIFIKNTDIRDYDFIYFGFVSNYSSITLILLNYLDKYKIPYLKYESFDMFNTKLFAMNIVNSLGYPYIPTIATFNLNKNVKLLINEEIKFPLIFKNPKLDKGVGVFKIENMEKLSTLFIDNSEIFLIQKFIENDGDIRVIVIKNKVELISKRNLTNKNEFRSNIVLGGIATSATLPKHILEMCEDISKHFTCDILGFDVIQDLNSGEFYFMEVNVSPHMPTFCLATGINLIEIIVQHIINNITRNR